MKRLTIALCLLAAPISAQDSNNRNSCSELWGAVGWPESHKDPAAMLLHIPEGMVVPAPEVACREHYVTQYNYHTKNPDFVIERLNASTTDGDNTRPDVSFKPDELLPSGGTGALDRDYRNSGLARGHNAASADFKSDADWMKQTFRFSNAVPQVQATIPTVTFFGTFCDGPRVSIGRETRSCRRC